MQEIWPSSEDEPILVSAELIKPAAYPIWRIVVTPKHEVEPFTIRLLHFGGASANEREYARKISVPDDVAAPLGFAVCALRYPIKLECLYVPPPFTTLGRTPQTIESELRVGTLLALFSTSGPTILSSWSAGSAYITHWVRGSLTAAAPDNISGVVFTAPTFTPNLKESTSIHSAARSALGKINFSVVCGYEDACFLQAVNLSMSLASLRIPVTSHYIPAGHVWWPGVAPVAEWARHLAIICEARARNP